MIKFFILVQRKLGTKREYDIAVFDGQQCVPKTNRCCLITQEQSNCWCVIYKRIIRIIHQNIAYK